jgi:hypothetical protein
MICASGRELGFALSHEVGAADIVNVSLNLVAASQNRREGETSLTATAASGCASR